MNRREFMRRMFGTAVTIAVPDIKIFPKTALGKLQEFGLPEWANDGTYGTWLGIKRSDTPLWTSSYVCPTGSINPDTIRAIRRMIEKAMEHYGNQLDLEVYHHKGVGNAKV